MKRMTVILLAILLVGCQDNEPNIGHEKQNIVVEKQVGDENKYEEFNKVTDTKQVEEARGILHDALWKDAQVDFIRPPDYRFIYEFKNPNIDAKAVLHQVWISPKKDGLEVMQGPREYAQLPQAESARLFEILTGESLGD
ncbi:hypothetical protein NQ095_06105 [Rossellomorea sp. SC111]|uniref:hypothetical protein n=1 Tax=Rossellomorea sp. SC111 TaxID=2968985 RepID=UPI00215A5966|nr:hypothetical protein [Rossellomorea sp. SC111]MCR8847974.1 hypothetical protein [Rossellomorea sp. SC111]